MDSVNQLVESSRKEILYFQNLIYPLVLNLELKESIENTEFGKTGSADETYQCLGNMVNLFERLLTMKNNEEYVQEAANQSPSIHDINTDEMMKSLDLCSYMIFDYVKKNPQTYKHKDLELLVNVVKSNEPLIYQNELVPGSANVFDQKNLTLMILDDKPIDAIPKGTEEVNFEIKNTEIMVYDLSTLIEEEVITNLNIKNGEGINDNIMKRFNNFHKFNHIKGKNQTTMKLLDSDLYLKIGDHFRRIDDYPDWDIKNSKFIPQLVFRNDVENKRLMMAKTNTKKRYKRKNVTGEELGLMKSTLRKTSKPLADIVFSQFREIAKTDEQIVRLLSITNEIDKKVNKKNYEKFLSDKKNFTPINNI